MEDNYNNHRRPQEDLPYEQQMLYIIKDYRRINTFIEKARTYGETMERENKELRRQIAIANNKHANDVRELQEMHRRLKMLKGMLLNCGVKVTKRMFNQ